MSLNQETEARASSATTMSKTDNLMNLAGQIRAAMDAKKKLRGDKSESEDESDSSDSDSDEWSD